MIDSAFCFGVDVRCFDSIACVEFGNARLYFFTQPFLGIDQSQAFGNDVGFTVKSSLSDQPLNQILVNAGDFNVHFIIQENVLCSSVSRVRRTVRQLGSWAVGQSVVLVLYALPRFVQSLHNLRLLLQFGEEIDFAVNQFPIELSIAAHDHAPDVGPIVRTVGKRF